MVKHTQESFTDDRGAWQFTCTCGHISTGNHRSSLDFWLNEHRDMHYYESTNQSL